MQTLLWMQRLRLVMASDFFTCSQDHARIQADWLEACLGLAADKEDDRDEE